MSRRSSGAPVQLGTAAVIPNICHGSTETPAAPDSTPTYEIRDVSGLGDGSTLVTGTTTALSGVTGGYFINHTLTADDGFTAGEVYHAIITYAISTTQFKDVIDIPVT
jgi:hypothetical protein